METFCNFTSVLFLEIFTAVPNAHNPIYFIRIRANLFALLSFSPFRMFDDDILNFAEENVGEIEGNRINWQLQFTTTN